MEVGAGTFLMGSPDEAAPDDEQPQRAVTLSAFRIQRHEVTNAEYRRLLPGHQGDDELAAAYVSWYAATTYAGWLGGRLPTEAEWELAARAGCPHRHCTQGGRQASVDDVAWTLSNSKDPETGEIAPSPVMRLEPNPWGLYDMQGNLWEWTADFYAKYPNSPQRDPWGPPATGSGRRVIRGGSARDAADGLHATSRSTISPADVSEYQGFRVVLPAAPRP